ncbi:substrate-binding periplasmic protein [Kiloniella antarctica]|uniref:Substrate-binding periplasmic protein n=1 Tax=Kiloniella antarctica TaxID=1550907 RepID=A0ABW5BLY3_9PROT
MLRRLTVLVIGLFLSLSLVSSYAHATEEKINVTVGEWPPFLSQKLEGGGVIADLIRDIFKAEGIEAELTFLPWARGYHETSIGDHNAMGVWMHKDERDAEFLFSDPVLIEQFVFFYLKKNRFDWQDLDDLAGYRMGGGIKYSYGPEFDAALAAQTFLMDRQPNDRANFEKLLAGRVQLYPQEISVGYFALQSQFAPEQQARITHHPKAILNNKSYVLFPKSLPGSEALMARFNKRLQEFKDNGTYQLYIDRLGAKEAS